MDGDEVTEAGASVESHSPEIDAEAIMRQIRENIRQQRTQAEARGPGYEAFVEDICAPQATTRFDRSLYDALRRMSTGYDKPGVGLLLAGSSIPLVAPLVQRVRAACHRLVIYYVNELASQQVRFNEYVIRAMATLVKDLEGDPIPGEVEALRREVAQLRAEVERLKPKAEQENE
jgi:hypothetical protein